LVPPINSRLKVRIAGFEGEVFSSRVEDLEESRVTIAYPTSHGDPVPVKRRTSVEIEWPTELGPCFQTGHIVGRADMRIPAVVIELTGTPRSLQRRQFVRVASLLDVDLAVEDDVHMTGYVLDISANGCRARFDAEIEVGATVHVTINVPDQDPFDLEAKVVRDAGDRSHGLAFLDMRKADQERLMRFVFLCQRRQIFVRSS
jgi:c-di-GMP-binding flagellar brake protein YcgR